MLGVALLRGINVGGNNKVPMAQLKVAFNELGLTNVATYINSGNVVFEMNADPAAHVRQLEERIEAEFGFAIPVTVRTHDEMRELIAALPDDWVFDAETKVNVLFLVGDTDRPDFIDRLTLKPGIDDAFYVSGAVAWKYTAENANRTGLRDLLSVPEYREVTIRNANTARKLLTLMDKLAP